MEKYTENLLARFPCLETMRSQLADALSMLRGCVAGGGKIMTCGNGGSAADAEHIVGELMKGFLLRRVLPQATKEKLVQACPERGPELAENLQQTIAAVSLVGGISLNTAYANDINPELCFAQQVLGLGRIGDIVWGVSTSGNSSNVNYALTTARALGLRTLGLSGRDGGMMAGLCDVELRVPEWDTPTIQELHLPIYHALCADLEAVLFG